jgi:heat shock protein HslJ
MRQTLTVVAAATALTACASEGGAAQSADLLVGSHWTLVNVAKDGTGTGEVSAASNTWLEVTAGYGLRGRDGCSAFQADGQRTGRTVTITNVAMAANGCLSDHGTLDATREAVDAMLAGPPVHLRVSLNRLTITARDYTLIYTRMGSATQPSTDVASMTTSRSSSQ